MANKKESGLPTRCVVPPAKRRNEKEASGRAGTGMSFHAVGKVFSQNEAIKERRERQKKFKDRVHILCALLGG